MELIPISSHFLSSSTCEIKSGSQIATEFMNIDQASEWLQSVQQNIVGMQAIETMSREEAIDVLKLFNRR